MLFAFLPRLSPLRLHPRIAHATTWGPHSLMQVYVLPDLCKCPCQTGQQPWFLWVTAHPHCYGISCEELVWQLRVHLMWPPLQFEATWVCDVCVCVCDVCESVWVVCVWTRVWPDTAKRGYLNKHGPKPSYNCVCDVWKQNVFTQKITKYARM